MFVVVMYAGALLIAFYKQAKEYMTEDIPKGLIHDASYAPIIVKAKTGKSAFTAGEHGCGEYMPYLCNLDYVMPGAPILKVRPPVFMQGQGYK